MRKTGEEIEDIQFETSTGDVFQLSKSKADAVIIFFYPGDFTPGCTKQVCSFRDHFDQLKQLNVELFGISLDSAQKHEKFREAYSLPYALVADHDRTLSRTFGVLRLGGFLKVRRATFIIDPKTQTILEAFSNEFQMHAHAERVLQFLQKHLSQ
ncbi:MAG: peroxiredoxin [Myxococcota bacterium]